MIEYRIQSRSDVVVKVMRFFTKNRSSKKRIIEEWVYERVADELDMGDIRRGLWTKARGLSAGDANKCESIYIQLRAESIVDEVKINQEIYSQSSSKRVQEDKKKNENDQLRAREAQQKLEVESRKAKEREDELRREEYKERVKQERLERRVAEEERKRRTETDKLRKKLASIGKANLLEKLIFDKDLGSKATQYGSFQFCIACGVAKTRNKVDGISICNTCLRKPSLV